MPDTKISRSSIGRFFSQRPWLLSTIFILLLCFWLGFGALKAEEPRQTANDTIPFAKVIYQSFEAELTDKHIDLYGRTAPNRQAKIGAEIAGKITQISIAKGQPVNKGQQIVLIDQADLAAQLESAQALFKLKQKEFSAAESLKNRGLQGEVAFASAQAALAEASAVQSRAQLALRNTSVVAPFDGIVEDILIEKGDFVGVGDPMITFIDLSKLVIEADVSERHIQKIKQDQIARVRFIDGSTIDGKVRYISRVSSPTTNTFAIEVELDNPNQTISAGVSAEVEMSLETQLAVKITPAMLALDDQGNLGVKTLQQDRVRFIPIQLVKAEQDGVWLTGLGETVDIITVGQGFVRDGDQVIAVKKPNHSAQ
uniref:efflux RND transporter periplasmic adaptor subunit n=1 Tax=Vibrio anguillarum TaxID=55601 RepID=UPI0040472AA2